MNYQWFENDINSAWASHLVTEFEKIQKEVFDNCHKSLRLPNFKINTTSHKIWGTWDKNTRTISLSIDLLRKFEWPAVVRVFRHEVAHQIVDELLNIESKPHGEAWKLACQMVNIPPVVSDSQQNLESFKGDFPTNPTIDKIRKLIVYGNDNGISQEESQVFLNKAQELMIKYNVDVNSIQGVKYNNTFHIFRPVGPLVDGHKTWLGIMATLVCDFYNVTCIWKPAPNRQKYIEFFGTPDNLDIAEYVFHALITQAEYLYNTFKEKHQEEINESKSLNPKPVDFNSLFQGLSHDELVQAQEYLTASLIESRKPKIYKNYRRISKRAFMQGLVHGYRQKLQKEKQIIFDTIKAEDKAIITRAHILLKEEFEEFYHPHNISYGRSRGSGYNDGHLAGSNLSLARGISSNGNRNYMLQS